MSEESKIADAETPVDKKKRLRAARELADELLECEKDEKFLLRETLRKTNRKSAGDIYQEYAMAILEKVLDSDKVDVMYFSQGTTDIGKKEMFKVCCAVSNMAGELTKEYKRRYPI